LKDCLGRTWQCGTVQLDFSIPARLDATYVAEDGSKQTPVMIHRAIFGSLERFIGVLIEHYAGKFPAWLAPVQAVIMNITDRQADYVTKITEKLQEKGFRVKFDLRNEKIGFKIREHTLQRVPYLVVAGDRELENQTIAVRTREGRDLGSMSLEAFIQLVQEDIASHGQTVMEE
jgi:threonyl-tRNA synthetase